MEMDLAPTPHPASPRRPHGSIALLQPRLAWNRNRPKPMEDPLSPPRPILPLQSPAAVHSTISITTTTTIKASHPRFLDASIPSQRMFPPFMQFPPNRTPPPPCNSNNPLRRMSPNPPPPLHLRHRGENK